MDTTKIRLNAYKIEDYIETTIFFTNFVMEHMLVPGKVENWMHVSDMGHQGITEFPLKAIIKFSVILQKMYKCRLANSFVLNPPSSIYYLWKCAKPFIDKATQSKVCIENKGYSGRMLELFDPEQVEEKFGGKAPNITRFWPPVFPNSSKEPYDNKEPVEKAVEKPKKKKTKKERKLKNPDYISEIPIDIEQYVENIDVFEDDHMILDNKVRMKHEKQSSISDVMQDTIEVEEIQLLGVKNIVTFAENSDYLEMANEEELIRGSESRLSKECLSVDDGKSGDDSRQSWYACSCTAFQCIIF